MPLSPLPELVGFPALGALAALFGRYASLQRRRRIVLICGAILTTGVFLPSLISLAGAPPVAMVLLLALFAGASTIMVSRWGLGGPGAAIFVFRSEEHTSELQSLMRISYAVFCLIKKKKTMKL